MRLSTYLSAARTLRALEHTVFADERRHYMLRADRMRDYIHALQTYPNYVTHYSRDFTYSPAP